MRCALLALLAIAPLTATAQDVTIGTSATYPPIIIHDGAAPVSGLEGDLMALICARAGWTCTWDIVPFDVVFPALEAGRIDIAANSLGWTAERAARVHMSCPYRPMGSDGMEGTFYVRDPSHDPRSGPVAVLRDTLHATALATAGLDAVLFSTDQDALSAVIRGDIPAYFGSDPAIETFDQRDQLTPAGRLPVISGGTSIAVSPLRPDLAAELDAQLAALSAEGVITTLIQTWTGGGVDDPIALCERDVPIS